MIDLMRALSRLPAGLALLLAIFLAATPAAADWVVVGPNGMATGAADEPNDSDLGAIGATGCSASSSPTGRIQFDSNTCTTYTNQPDGARNQTAQYQARATAEGKPNSLIIYDYSMGLAGNGSCLSCDFLSYFMVALTDFSYSTYQVLYDMLIALIPMTLMIWLGYRVVKLMVTGGEDGKGFLMNVVGKTTLFVMIWLILLGGSVGSGAGLGNRYLWGTTGPLFLDYSFKLSNTIRTEALNNQSMAGTGGRARLMCDGVTSNIVTNTPSTGASFDPYVFVTPAMRTGCMTERVHFMGVAAGTAIALGSQSYPTSLTDISGWFSFLFTMIVKLVIGFFVIMAFGLSAIWLLFLILDVIVRAMITAAFSPVLIGLFLYQPTRGIATNSLRALIGSAVTATAIGLIGILAYVLVVNTVDVYNATYQNVNPAYERFNMTQIPDGSFQSETPVNGLGAGPVKDMRELIERAEIGSTDPDVGIPIDLGAPWFWYLVFVGLAIFSLGKKIISMIEGAIGTQGMSAMADRATQLAKTGMVGGAALSGGMVAGGSALAALGGVKIGVPVASYLAGAGKQGAGSATDAARDFITPAGRKNNIAGAGMLKSFGKNAGDVVKRSGKAAAVGGRISGEAVNQTPESKSE